MLAVGLCCCITRRDEPAGIASRPLGTGVQSCDLCRSFGGLSAADGRPAARGAIYIYRSWVSSERRCFGATWRVHGEWRLAYRGRPEPYYCRHAQCTLHKLFIGMVCVCVGGGGAFGDPSHLAQRIDRRQTTLDRPQPLQRLQFLLGSFLGQVNIEVIRGHQMKMLLNTFFLVIIPETSIGKEGFEKAMDSPLHTLPQHAIRFDLRTSVKNPGVIKRSGHSPITLS